MRAIKGKLFVKFANNKALQNEIDFGGGHKLEIIGDERPEHWANNMAVVVASGVEDIEPGTVIGVDYRVIFQYEHRRDKITGEQVPEKIYLNEYEIDGQKVFMVDQSFVLFKRVGDEFQAYGDWVVLRPIKKPVQYANMPGVGMAMSGDQIKRGAAIYISGGGLEKEGVMPGDEVLIEERFRSNYTFGYQNDFIIFSVRYVMAKKLQEVTNGG